MKFTMPDQLPSTFAELDALAKQAEAEVNVFRARHVAGDEFSYRDVERLEYLNASHTAVVFARAAALPSGPQRTAAVAALPPDPERMAWAAHEAGHAVIAACLGGEVQSAEVFRPEGGAPIVGRDGWQLNGKCNVVPSPTVTLASGHLVAAAGPAAQAVALHGRNPTQAQINHVLAGQHDQKVLQQHALTAGAFAKSDPIREVMPMVERCWPAITTLAADMYLGMVITHTDITAALGLSEDRILHAFELANIRAGMRTVPQPAAVGGAGHAERL